MSAAIETYFSDVAALLDASLAAGETYTCRFEGESSDFVRFNRGKVRQPGSVDQRYLRLEWIRGLRHAERAFSVSGDLARDRDMIAQAIAALRATLDDVPDDPHLNLPARVESSRVVRDAALVPAEDVVAKVVHESDGVDLVGFYASGPIYRGFANALGQRNWHQVSSFKLEWSLYHRADKAVKTTYGGYAWSPEAFASRMREARERLALLAVVPKTLEPGAYRAYLTPSAMEEIAGMLCWGGFSGRALESRQSCLFRMRGAEAALHPSIAIRENTADGVAPAFQAQGFTRPDRVPLVEDGQLVGALVSPRTAKEFSLPTNGANSEEMPESLDMAAGDLATADALQALDTGLYIGNLWYVNFSDRPACRLTGMTRFASFWVDRGRIVAPVNVMRFDDSVYRLLGENLVALTKERDLLASSSTYHERSVASMRLPGAVVRDMAFTL
jgi:predicted Zn-dependent protease